jgi:hypothetical protein
MDGCFGMKKNIRYLHRGINEFKKGYQPRTNTVGENGDLLADFRNILNSWKNYLCHILNIHCVDDVRHTEMRTDEPFVTEIHCSEVEIATEKMKQYKSPGTDQIPVEPIRAIGNTLH